MKQKAQRISAPIADMLDKYAESKSIRLHTPSHGGLLHSWDITELPFSDNLTNPQGAIWQSQQLFASQVGVKHAMYITQGSTLGNWAMINCAQGTVLVERNSHISVFNALKTLNKPAIILNNDMQDGLFLPVSLQAVVKTVEENPNIKTVLLTSPNYFGYVSPLEEIYHYLQSKNITLFVDSAHGAAFGFTDLLPPFAAKHCSACVVSMHKTLPCLTGAAVLFTNDDGLEKDLKKSINLFASTSPSYLILGSIDIARAMLEKTKQAFWFALCDYITVAKNNLEKGGIYTLANHDFLRMVIECQSLGHSGSQVYNMLAQKYIFAEMYTENYVVLICPINTTFKVMPKIVKTLLAIKKGNYKSNTPSLKHNDVYTKLFRQSEQVEILDLKDCLGRVSAETICSDNAPCVPYIIDGEKIDKYTLERLEDKIQKIAVEKLTHTD